MGTYSLSQQQILQDHPSWFKGTPRLDDPEYPIKRPYTCKDGYDERDYNPETIALLPGAKGRIIAREGEWLLVTNPSRDPHQHGWVAANAVDIGVAIWGRKSFDLGLPSLSTMSPDSLGGNDGLLTRTLYALCKEFEEYAEVHDIDWLKTKVSTTNGARVLFVKNLLNGFEAAGIRDVLARQDFTMSDLLTHLVPYSTEAVDDHGNYLKVDTLEDDSFAVEIGATWSFRAANSSCNDAGKANNVVDTHTDGRRDPSRSTFAPICRGLKNEDERVIGQQILILLLGTYARDLVPPLASSKQSTTTQAPGRAADLDRLEDETVIMSNQEDHSDHRKDAREMTELAARAFETSGWRVALSRDDSGVKGNNISSPILERSHVVFGTWLRTDVQGGVSIFRRGGLKVHKDNGILVLELQKGWKLPLSPYPFEPGLPPDDTEVLVVVEIVTHGLIRGDLYMCGWEEELAPWDDWHLASGVSIRLEWADPDGHWRYVYPVKQDSLSIIDPSAEASLDTYERMISLRNSLLRRVPETQDSWRRPFPLARVQKLDFIHNIMTYRIRDDNTVTTIPASTRTSPETIMHNLARLGAQNIDVQPPSTTKCDACKGTNRDCEPTESASDRFTVQCSTCFRMGRPCTFSPEEYGLGFPEYMLRGMPHPAPDITAGALPVPPTVPTPRPVTYTQYHDFQMTHSRHSFHFLNSVLASEGHLV